METTPRRGGAAMSPSHTPRSNKPTRHRDRGPLPLTTTSSNLDSKGGAVAAAGAVNIQVLLRCRPSSEEERRSNAPIVITCNDQRREVSVAHNIANKQIDRTFVFDNVFGPKSPQQDVFNHALVPLVNEVLDGYNCTIFVSR